MTVKVDTLRASEAARALECWPSVQPATGVAISETHEAATLGTAAHDGMARIVKGLPVESAALAALHGVPDDDLGWMLANGRAMVAEMGLGEGGETEVYLSAEVNGVTITGHLDVLKLGIPASMARVIDWKSGRKDSDYRDQMIAYAVLVFGTYPAVREVSATVAWLRDKTEETYTITREDIPAWLDKLGNAIKSPDRYQTGEHCHFCPRKHECPALLQVSRQAVAIFDPTQAGTIALAALEPVQQIRLLRMAKMVVAQAKTLQDEFRKLLEAGPIDDGTTVLRLVDEPQRKVNAAKAWAVMQAHLTDEQMGEVVTVGMGKLEDAVASKAPPRGKAAAKRDLQAELEAAGAVTRVAAYKIKEERKR